MELRERAGLTLDDLSGRLGWGPGGKDKLHRLERGKAKRMDVADLLQIAAALDVSPLEVLGEDADLMKPDAVEVVADLPGAFAALAGSVNNRYYRAETNVLNQIGVKAGDIIPVNVSKEAIGGVGPLLAVLVRLVNTADPEAQDLLLLRQFMPPNLLATNSSERNWPPLSRDAPGVAIEGVLIVPHNLSRLA